MHVEQFNYLDINEYPTMKDHLNIDRYEIWNRLFPIEEKHDEKELNIEEDEIY